MFGAQLKVGGEWNCVMGVRSWKGSNKARHRCSTSLQVGAICSWRLIRLNISAIRADVMVRLEAMASH